MIASRSRLGIRVGTDLIATSDVAGSIACFGDRYLQRLFTAQEIATCQATPHAAAERFAARFAAKEATIKVLRPATAWIDFREVEVLRGQEGAPSLVLHGQAAALAEAAGLYSFSVSLSHETTFAVATVAALEETPPGAGSPQEEETKS